MTTAQDRPCWLYRFDGPWEGRPARLYIGISTDPFERYLQHLHDNAGRPDIKPWVDVWTNHSVTRFPSRGEALRAEAEAIRTELPLFNVVHNGRNPNRVVAVPRPVRASSPRRGWLAAALAGVVGLVVAGWLAWTRVVPPAVVWWHGHRSAVMGAGVVAGVLWMAGAGGKRRRRRRRRR